MIKKQAGEIGRGEFVYLEVGGEKVLRGPITGVVRNPNIQANVMFTYPGGAYECPRKVQLDVLERVPVKLTGRDGNAMMVVGACSKAARRAGWPDEAIKLFDTYAKSDDYEHLLFAAQECFDVD
jgi:hypothetical protein